jgi:hypothetical protein
MLTGIKKDRGASLEISGTWPTHGGTPTLKPEVAPPFYSKEGGYPPKPFGTDLPPYPPPDFF